MTHQAAQLVDEPAQEVERRRPDPDVAAWRAKFEKELGEIRSDIAVNTQITAATNARLDEHTKKTDKMFEVFEALTQGVKVLGWIGTAGTKVAHFVVKGGAFLLAAWAFLWAIGHGASIIDAFHAAGAALTGGNK